MLNVYINGMLCDIDNKSKDVLFKRQFLNPTSLNTEDRQRTYSIFLPKSPKNNRIFGYKNVEETTGKFSNNLKAVAYVNGLKVLEGFFLLMRIEPKGYVGNLAVPLLKTTSEIFGDRTMNQAKEWLIPFGAFKDSIEEYNKMDNAPCIFPYVLYGLLPKEKNIQGIFTSKNVWDNTVRLGMDDLPPSVNCLQMIRRLLESEGYNVGGSAFGDDRLNKLYVSYKNPTDYEMEWNYARNGKIDLNVQWSNFYNYNTSTDLKIEPTTIFNNNIYKTELLSTVNAKVNINSDDGSNILKTDITDFGETYIRHGIIIPRSGIYKVKLNISTSLDMRNRNLGNYQDQNKRILVASANFGDDTLFGNNYIEIKLLRDKVEGSFNIENQQIDRLFYSPTINQTDDFDVNNPENFPKYFPQAGKTMFVDPERNSNLVCGIAFGKSASYVNDGAENLKRCNPIAIKGGLSWNYENTDFTTAAATGSGYNEVIIDNDNNIINQPSERFEVESDMREGYARIASNSETGTGEIQMLIYLEKGERLSLVDTTGMKFITFFPAYIGHTINADLVIEPYKKDENWLYTYLTEDGESKEFIPYNENSDFLDDNIDLSKFLPSEEKIDDWLNNFCKAFNLTLAQTDVNDFELNIKQVRQTSNKSIIDIKTHQNLRTNLDLNLPSAYKLGFKIDEDEQGFYETGETGGGEYKTGVLRGNVIEQISNFSYCWYKPIYDSEGNVLFNPPIISDHEAWRLISTRDYEEMQKNWYIDKPQRFWYKDKTIQVTGFGGADTLILIATVRNSLPQNIDLDYHNETFSILRNFYTLFFDSDNCYTEVESFLDPDEYYKLPYSLVLFNGDLYYPAEIDGYDPYGNRRAKLKLIRKL